MTTLTFHLTRLAHNRRLFSLLPLVILGALMLSGCTGATEQIKEASTQTMDGVKAFSAFAAIGIAIYWLTFIVFFGLRNAWPEGYNQISNTWKAGAFITILAVVGIPALLTWASGIVEAGGFSE